MLSSSDPKMTAIPKGLLDLVFTIIRGTAASSSYTKKSAGLPPLVESIVTAEPRGRERHLLKYTISELMEIARLPLPEQPDAKQDLPQSHSLNILRSLFVNSSLSWNILPYAEVAVQLAIDGFSSSNWSVQNSSMQLLGALIARIFGQKKVQDEHSQVNTLSAPEFFQRYPRLRSYLLREVKRAAALHQGAGAADGRLHLIPSLQPVLLVLTKLSSGIATQQQKRELQEFVDPVQSLASSPIYSVRDLASRALLPLLADADAVSSMSARLLDRMPSPQRPAIFNQNRLHGDLLMIQRLLAANISSTSVKTDQVREITEKLRRSLWIGSCTNPCTVTRAQFMGICTLWWEGAFDAHPEGLTSLLVTAKNLVEEFFNQSTMYQVGLSALGHQMTTSFLSLSKFIPAHISDLSTVTHTLLAYGQPEVREVTLNHLNNDVCMSELEGETKRSLQWQVTDLVIRENNSSCLAVALEVWLQLSRDLSTKPERDWSALLSRLLPLADGGNGRSGLCAPALPALSVVLRLAVPETENINLDLMSRCCDLILRYSDPGRCETLRLSAARALQHCGLHILQVCSPDHVTHCNCAFMVMKAGMLLLQDEQPDVREEAARFASMIPRDAFPALRTDTNQLHCTAGLKVLLKYVCSKFCQNMDFLDTVVSLLVGEAFSAQELISEEVQGNSFNLFEQESVNIYSEGVMEATEVFQALKHSITSLAESKINVMRKWVEGRWDFTQRNMAALVTFLGTHPVTANSFYAATGHCKPYQALHRLLLYVSLLREASMLVKATSEGAATAMRKTADHLDSLRAMYHVFPLLKDSIPANLIAEETEDDSSEMD